MTKFSNGWPTGALECGEGIQGPTNASLWAGLLAFVSAVQKPVIIAGDFNISPEVFMTTTMAQLMQAQVLATGEEACNTGSDLDWALVSTALVADVTEKKIGWFLSGRVPRCPFTSMVISRTLLCGNSPSLARRQNWNTLTENGIKLKRLILRYMVASNSRSFDAESWQPL